MIPRFVALILVACGGVRAPAEPPARPDVLLITLDTTRADRIGVYGYDAARTPHLDRLAERGRRYSRAWSPMPLTIPSHASLFTGLYPPNHGIRSNGDAILSADRITLAERLQEAGYHTGGSVAAFVTTRIWGFDQGFDAYFDEVPQGRDFWHAERPGEAVVDDLIAWRRAVPDDGRPIFGWAHLYDAHHPYAPPEPFRSDAEGRPYDGEIAYVDHQVGRLIEAFDRPTIVIVVADHGEALGQHGELTHGLYVYDATQRIPYLVAGPGITPAVIDEPVSLVDVAPTLLAHLGLAPLDGIDGRVAPGDPPKPVYLESWQLAQRFGIAPHLALVDGDHLLVGVPTPELYDISGPDPAQQRDLAEALPDRVAELQAKLEALAFLPPSSDPAHPAAPDVSAQLAALGYVDGTFTGDLSGPLPDPKSRADMLKKVQRLEVLQHEGNLPAIAAVLEELAAAHPEIVEFHSRRATLLARQGKTAEALDILEEALGRDPDNAMLKHAQAAMLARSGRPAEATILFQEAAAAMPFAPRIRAMAVASLLQTEGGAREAVALGLSYLQEHPDDAHVAGLVGLELVRHGQLPQGLALLEVGVLADRPERGVALHVAAARQGQGKPEEARRLLELELRNHPNHVEAAITLLKVMMRQGDWEGVVQRCQPFFDNVARRTELPRPEGAPPPPPPPPRIMADMRHMQAQALFNLTRFAEARQALDSGLAAVPDHAMLLLLDANLLKQEGHPERAVARFEEAKAARERESAARPPGRSPR